MNNKAELHGCHLPSAWSAVMKSYTTFITIRIISLPDLPKCHFYFKNSKTIVQSWYISQDKKYHWAGINTKKTQKYLKHNNISTQNTRILYVFLREKTLLMTEKNWKEVYNLK